MQRTTVATTGEGWIRSVSPGFLALVGQQVEDLAGINLIDLVHPHDAAAARRLLGDAGAIGFEPNARLRFFQPAGEWANTTVSIRTADDGRRILEIVPATTAAPLPDRPVAVQLIADTTPAPTGAPATSTAPPASLASSPPGRSLSDRFPALTTWLHGRELSLGQIGAALGVILFGLVLRTWDLSSLPTGFHGDEGITGLEAERILREGSIGVYTGSALGQPTAPFYLDAITVGLFGNTIWATRILSAIAGTLAVAATYRVVQRRYDHRTGIACAFAFATMTWSIHFSRIAFGLAWWPLLIMLTIGAIDKAATDQSRRSWFVAGALSAFGVYVYNSHWGFGLPVVGFVTMWVLTRLVTHKRVRFDGLAFGVLGAFIVGLPMLQFILDNNGFFNHFNAISRRSSPEWLQAGLGEKVRLYAGWYWESWTTLFITPVFDGVDASGINKPVPMAFGLVAVVGLVDILRRHRSTFTSVLLATMLLLPTTTVLTSLAVARRTYALSPLVAILVGFGALALVDLAKKTSSHHAAGSGAAIALALVALFSGVLPYFTAFRNSPGQQGVFANDLVVAAEAVQDAAEDGPVHVNWFSPRHDFGYPTLDFLLGDTTGETRAPLGTGFVPDLDLTLNPEIADHDQVFVLIGPYVDELDRLQETNPTGTIIEQRTEPPLVVYEVPKT